MLSADRAMSEITKKVEFVTTVAFLFLRSLVMVSSQKSSGDAACPGADSPKILQAQLTKQLFLTPGFVKGRYPSNVDCHWIIRSTLGRNRVQLSVFNSQLEDKLFSTCDDFIEVLDGETTDSSLIARWCGYRHPLNLIGTGGSLYVRFKTDAAYELRGANMSYEEFLVPGCPPEWYLADDHCYRLFSPRQKLTWVEAQRHCNHHQANLLTIKGAQQYRRILQVYGQLDERPWIGYTDAAEEGNFKSVNPTDLRWPDNFPAFSDHDTKDCLFWDASVKSGVYYGVADCRDRRSFICKRSKGMLTVAYPPPEAAVRQSYERRTTTIGLTPWNIVIPVSMLFVLLLCLLLTPFCYNRQKKRRQQRHNRVLPTNTPTTVGNTETDGDARYDTNNVTMLTSNGPLSYANHAYEPHQTEQDGSPRGSPNQKSPLTITSTTTPPSVEQNYQTDEILVDARQQKQQRVTTVVENGGVARPNGLPHLHRNGLTRHHNGGTDITGGGLPPIEPRFDRPHIRMLDNVSAISMDEFWSRAAERISLQSRGSSSKQPSHDGRTVL